MVLDPIEAYHFDLHGYLVVKQAFEPGLVAALDAELQRLEQLPSELGARGPVSWTPVVNEVRLLNVLDRSPRFLEPIDHPAILPRVEALRRRQRGSSTSGCSCSALAARVEVEDRWR